MTTLTQQETCDDHQQGLEQQTQPEIIPSYISERELMEKFRIDSLINLEHEKESQEMRRKELEVLERFSSPPSSSSMIPTLKEQVATPLKVVQEIVESTGGKAELIKLLVGGKLFITTLNTIRKRENMLKIMLDSGIGIDRSDEHDGAVILDQLNPDYFPILLEHLRTGSTNYVGLWEEASESSVANLKELLQESDFFGTRILSARIALLIKDYEKQLKEIDNNNENKSKKAKSAMLKAKSETSITTTPSKESDEEWLNKFATITIQEKLALENYVSETKDELSRENQALKEKEAKFQKSPITFNVRGTKFTISMEKLLVHKESIFPSILSELKTSEEIFLDRDGEIFGYIFEYLLDGSTSNIPKEISKRKLVFKEAKEFNILSLINFLDPLRYPIEEIGSENLKIKQEEDFIRKMFVTDRSNPILNDPYLHLINVFGNENASRSLFKPSDPTLPLLLDFENAVEASELCNEYSQLTIPEKPTICKSREVFFSQFHTFTGGLFEGMDWSNVFCAGGGVLACMLKVPDDDENETEKSTTNKPSSTRKKISWGLDDGSDAEGADNTESDRLTEEGYFTVSSDEESTIPPAKKYGWQSPYSAGRGQREAPLKKIHHTTTHDFYTRSEWKSSDIDLFLYGMNEKQAEEKIVYLYNLFSKNLGSDMVIIRTQHAITFKSNYLRSVQVILRIYKSPSEIIQSFDINCCCVGFDGNQVYCLPRAVVAISTRCNIVDPDRQSTTYELRLVKYALRGFRIAVAGYSEKKIVNSNLFERESLYFPRPYSVTKQKKKAQIKHVTGLARILMTIHAYKHNRRRNGVFSSIGGTTNLSKTMQILEPSKQHDYNQLPEFRNKLVSHLVTTLEKTVEYAKKANKKPYFEFSLNNIEEIIDSKNPVSNLPPHIEWLTIEPGTQSVGSFHPHTRNFFIDAYVDPKELNKQKAKYEWSYSQYRYYTATKFDETTSRMLEKNYRKHLTDQKNTELLYCEPIEGYQLDFSSMRMKSTAPPPEINEKSKSNRLARVKQYYVNRIRRDSKLARRRMKLDEYFLVEGAQEEEVVDADHEEIIEGDDF